MAYYDALIAKWPSAPAGTTDSKITWINAEVITGQIPASFMVTADQLANCVNYTEFKALTPATNQTNLLNLLNISGPLKGGSANTSLLVVGMIIDYFPPASTTISNLTQLAKAAIMPWWQATVAQGGGGLNSPVSRADCAACVPPLT